MGKKHCICSRTSNSDVSNGNLTFVNVPVGGTLTEIEVNADPSGYGYQAGIAMVGRR